MSVEAKRHRLASTRFLIALGVAVAVHTLALWVNEAWLSAPQLGESSKGAQSEAEFDSLELVEWASAGAAAGADGGDRGAGAGAREALGSREARAAGETSHVVSSFQRPHADGAAPGVAIGGEAPAAPAAPEAAAPFVDEAAEAPRLSLAQAGYGTPSPWLVPAQRAPSARAASERRLERNLAESAMRLDYQRSAGIEGPLVRALDDSAWGVVPPSSRARISVTLDAAGRVAAVEVLEVNDGMARWREVGEKVARRLASQKLRVPEGHGVELVFEVESQVLMPSGRKPQSGVSVLGIPLGQKDSTKEPMVRILQPHAEIDKVKVPKPGMPDEDMEIPQLRVGIEILSANPDPSDWAAPARQVVHTKLVRQRVL